MIDTTPMLSFVPAAIGMFMHLFWQMLYEGGFINEFTPKPFGCDKCFAIWCGIASLPFIPLNLIGIGFVMLVLSTIYMSNKYWN